MSILFSKNFIKEFMNKCNNVQPTDETIVTEVTIYRGNGIHITVDGPGNTERNFKQDPYFKVYSSEKIDSAEFETRISIVNPRYIYHSGGKPHKDLNSIEKKQLNKIFAKKDNWDKLIAGINSVCNTTDLTFEKPDFKDLED